MNKLSYILGTVLMMTASCNTQNNSKQIKLYQDSIKTCQEQLKALEAVSNSCQTSYDSLSTVLLNIEKPAPERSFSSEQKEIMAAVANLNKGWEELFMDNDVDKFLSNFTSNFSTNSVIIDSTNEPRVKINNTEGFRSYLESLLQYDISLDFGEIKFYTVHIEGEKFATSYVTELEVKLNNETIQTSTIEYLASGGKYSGKWIFGNYSWVKFDYYDISATFNQ